MTESIEVPAFPKTRWQKIDCYDLRLAVGLTALVMLKGDVETVLWCGLVFLGFVFFTRMIAPEWRFIELDHETAETDFVTVVLHWVAIIGLWLAIAFYIWDPAKIKVASLIISSLIYVVALALSSCLHSWDVSEE